jgi:uroporphyrinogen decarboxylase
LDYDKLEKLYLLGDNMTQMTSRERIGRILKHQPVDRIGLMESFWEDTNKIWEQAGFLNGEDIQDHFGLEMRGAGWINCAPVLDYGDQIIEETNEWKLVRNANGAKLKWWKNKAGTPEHVDFEVKDREGWEEKIKPGLLDESLLEKRVDMENYRKVREKCQAENLYFIWTGVNVFEMMHPMCGHEYMLMGMALDPDWVKDMCDVYAELTLKVQQILFEKEGKPDGIWYYEDMGFKDKPFMSPGMYKEIIWPSHKRTFDYAHSIGCPVFVHSCGMVESLIPGLIEAGMDCLQAMEVKAGMDLLKLKKIYGDKIAFCGGLDIRTLESNDLVKVEEELLKKIPIVMKGGGYILHTDHSVSSLIEYDTYRYFIKRGLEIGTYC